jgi:hypothetical protein
MVGSYSSLCLYRNERVGNRAGLRAPDLALLAALMCALVSYYAVNLVSRVAFDKDSQPPTRGPSEWDVSRRWSDWLLLLPWLLLFVNLLFVFGEVADCMHQNNLWKSGWSLCKSVSD